MKFSMPILVLTTTAMVLAADRRDVSALVQYTTITTSAITTYCPEPTVITHGGSTYTVTTATTLTITDCPCTITQPVPVSTSAPTTIYYTSCASTTTGPIYTNSSMTAQQTSKSYSNPLTVVHSTKSGVASPSGTAPYPTYATVNAASGLKAGAALGIAGLLAGVML